MVPTVNENCQDHIVHGLTQGLVIIYLVIARQPRGSQLATTYLNCPNIQYRCANEVHVQRNLGVIIKSKVIPQLWLVRSRHAIKRTCMDIRLSHIIFSFSKCTYSLCRKVAGSIPDGVIGIFDWHNPSGRTMALGLTQPLTEMGTRNISWGWKRPVRTADNFTTFMCRLSWNLGATASCNPQGLSSPVMGLLYFYLYIFITPEPANLQYRRIYLCSLNENTYTVILNTPHSMLATLVKRLTR